MSSVRIFLILLVLVNNSVPTHANPAPFLRRGAKDTAAAAPPAGGSPHLITLHKESTPVLRNGQIVSHKSSYFGKIAVGFPKAQEFKVVFDTGSAHIVLPSSECKDEACLLHKRYDIAQSETSLAVNFDSLPVPPEELCDQVTVGYGTGKVTGEFAKEMVCLDAGGDLPLEDRTDCLEVNIVMAVEMTPQPFKELKFDGIFGLSFDSLAMSKDFSFFHRFSQQLTGDSSQKAQFGVFLADDEHGEKSEIAIGGYNQARLMSPIQWSPVTDRKHGHWQVKIQEVRIGGKTLDMCRDGSCTGMVDTGTSHLGVPGAHLKEFARMTSRMAAGSDSDCRQVEAPEIEIVLETGTVLKLGAKDYMRKLPLPVTSKASTEIAPAADSNANSTALSLPGQATKQVCTPRVMAVNLQKPFGSNVFILGEPILYRYYTVYDWTEERVGFGLSASRQNGLQESDDEEDEPIFLMQVTLTVTVRSRTRAAPAMLSYGAAVPGGPLLLA